jgi:hypothetical protein
LDYYYFARKFNFSNLDETKNFLPLVFVLDFK